MSWKFGDPTVNQSLFNLAATCDPRDQTAEDIRQFQNGGVGDPNSLLEKRLEQIDCRDQEYQDIRSVLDRL